MSDQHLCGCKRCAYYELVVREVSAGDRRWAEQKAARSAWLDHVLAYQCELERLAKERAAA